MTKQPVAIITGASRGLGAELALRLIQEENYHVVGISRTAPSALQLGAFPINGITFVHGDVANEATARLAFDKAESLGFPQLLINAAGAATFGPAGGYSKSDIDTNFAAGLIGTILFTEEALRRYRSRGISIVNIMSTAAQVGRANESVYCASKWGARGYTESLRVELKGTPNRVIAVYPGGMRTDFWKAKGAENIDSTKFMNPVDVSSVILDTLKTHPGLYVSDLVINRG